MAQLNMAKLFTVFLLMVIGLALTPTVVEQVGYVTGTGGDNLTGASILIISEKNILHFFIAYEIFSIALSVSVGATNTSILGYHNLIYRRCINLYSIQRYKFLTQESNDPLEVHAFFSPAFLGYI